MEESLEKRRLLSYLILTKGELNQSVDPKHEVSDLTKAIEYAKTPKQFDNKAMLYLMRSRAYRKIADLSRAVSDLEQARNLIETWRSGSEREYRALYLETMQEVFDEAASLQIERNRYDLALCAVEESRSRALLDELRAGSLSPQGYALRKFSHNGCVEDFVEMLPNNTVVVAYAAVLGKLYAWVVTAAGIQTFAYLGNVKEIDQLVARLDKDIGGHAEKFDASAKALYGKLISPIARDLTGISDVILVPGGPLHQVPFAALIDPVTGQYLVEKFSISFMPSLGAYGEISKRRLTRVFPGYPKILVVSNPQFSHTLHPSLTALSGASREALSVPSDSLKGIDATKSRFIRLAPSYDIIQFSGHSIVNKLTPSLSMLVFASDDGSDGSLYAYEIEKLRLKKSSLVVLSSCETAEGKLASGEGLQSLMRSFVLAGAHGVVWARLYGVDDVLSARLVSALMENMGKR